MAFSLFPAFIESPLRIKYAQLEEGERLILLLRQHWITNIPWLITAIFLGLVPLFFIYTNQIYHFFTLPIPAGVKMILFIDWGLFVLAFIIEKSLFWYFNIYLVTSARIVDINFDSLQSQSTTDTQLKDIESKKASYKGIIGPLFNFGDVVIETAAKDQSIIFSAIPKPYVVVNKIQELEKKEEDQDGEGGDDARE